METILVLWPLIVWLMIRRSVSGKPQAPAVMRQKVDGLRVVKIKRTITRGVNPSEVIEIEYVPEAAPVAPAE